MCFHTENSLSTSPPPGYSEKNVETAWTSSAVSSSSSPSRILIISSSNAQVTEISQIPVLLNKRVEEGLHLKQVDISTL